LTLTLPGEEWDRALAVVFEYLLFLWISRGFFPKLGFSRGFLGAGGTQRPVLHVNEPKKTVARSARVTEISSFFNIRSEIVKYLRS
jgi:hypothetical protein